jgi:hypothetical protein
MVMECISIERDSVTMDSEHSQLNDPGTGGFPVLREFGGVGVSMVMECISIERDSVTMDSEHSQLNDPGTDEF